MIGFKASYHSLFEFPGLVVIDDRTISRITSLIRPRPEQDDRGMSTWFVDGTLRDITSFGARLDQDIHVSDIQVEIH
jgi:hypothetical protein